MSLNGTATHDYLYNALGERVRKAPVGNPSGVTHFHYDRDGKLIAESGPTGTVVREYALITVTGTSLPNFHRLLSSGHELR